MKPKLPEVRPVEFDRFRGLTGVARRQPPGFWAGDEGVELPIERRLPEESEPHRVNRERRVRQAGNKGATLGVEERER